MSEPSLPIGLLVAICGVFFVVLSAAAGVLLYVIRAEVRKGNETSDKTHAEMVPNHGSSMRDAVDRIERRQLEDRSVTAQGLEQVHGRISSLHRDLRALRERQDEHIDNHNKG